MVSQRRHQRLPIPDVEGGAREDEVVALGREDLRWGTEDHVVEPQQVVERSQQQHGVEMPVGPAAQVAYVPLYDVDHALGDAGDARPFLGELEAMRVVSRNPLAHSNACSFGCTGLRT